MMVDNSPLAQIEVSSGTVFSETGFEVSRSTVIPCQLPSIPPQNLRTFPFDDKLTNSASSYTSVGKSNAICGFSKGCGATGVSSLSNRDSNAELLEEPGTEHSSRAYRNMIGRILEVDRGIALQMLRWISYAARPLSVQELLDAISCQMSIKLAESDIERISGGLLNIADGAKVRLVHFSLRDYLDCLSKEDDIFGWDAVYATSHEMITDTCLQVLGPMDLLHPTNFIAQTGLSDIINHEGRHALIIYARQYWRFHYNHAEHQSYFLPGILHEKLRDGWKQEDGIFASRLGQWQTDLEIESRDSWNSNAFAFLDATLREGARLGMVKLVELELEMGASPNATDSRGMTPLHHAAAAGNCAVVKLLLDSGGDANVASDLGDTALFHAIANGNIEAADLLLNSESSSSHAQYDINQSQHGLGSTHFIHQTLSLVVSLSICCSDCGIMQNHYVLSKLPKSEEDEAKWPPIRIMDKRESLAACRLSAIREDNKFSCGTVLSEQRTVVKWFPGINMYKALGRAAESGIDGVLKLLILAGNDIEFLGRNPSLSKVMSKLSIS